MKRAAALVLASLLGSGLWACSPIIESHGYAPDDESLSEIAVGTDTKGSVQRKIGRPGLTGVFEPDAWFYEAETIEKYTYHAPKVTERRVVAISFDPATEVVTDVATYGIEDGRVIDLQTRTTPTYGRKLTIIQQLLGNLGRFNDETFKSIGN